MPRWYGNSTQRGLGREHQADLKRLLARHRDGDPCWRCGQPMYKSQKLTRDHVIDRALGGANGPAVLAHESCNKSAGATMGNRLKPRAIHGAGGDVLCQACGKPYHYAPRLCEICGAHYHPNHNAQRSCGRICGAEVQRRNRLASGPKSGKPRGPHKLKPQPSAIELLDDAPRLRAATRAWAAARTW